MNQLSFFVTVKGAHRTWEKFVWLFIARLFFLSVLFIPIIVSELITFYPPTAVDYVQQSDLSSIVELIRIVKIDWKSLHVLWFFYVHAVLRWFFFKNPILIMQFSIESEIFQIFSGYFRLFQYLFSKNLPSISWLKKHPASAERKKFI